MEKTASSQPNNLSRFHVPYDALRPCTNAFIDARSPGSDKKENFTIIGAGVAENPHQYVHITEPHGFNIGAARQPPNCTNSLHSHDTAEVFIIHSGQWRFFWGEDGRAGEVFLNPGDTISIPIHIFRGFENIGKTIGFMFAVLGGDDPGRVHWAPHVIERALGYGLVLLENGALIDTTLGEKVPEGALVVHPATPAEIAYIRVPSLAEMQQRVMPHQALSAVRAVSTSNIAQSFVIDDDALTNTAPPPISTPKTRHGFNVRHLKLLAGAQTLFYTEPCAEVLLIQSGSATWRNDAGDTVQLNSGDTFTVPRGMQRQLSAVETAEIFIVRGEADHANMVVTVS